SYPLVVAGWIIYVVCATPLRIDLPPSTPPRPPFSRSLRVVNRASKSAGLPLVSIKSRNAVNGPAEAQPPPAPAPKPRLLDGCEPIVSAIGQSPLAQVAGRCVS